MLTLRCTDCKHTVKIMSLHGSVAARCPLNSSEPGKGLEANCELTVLTEDNASGLFFLEGERECCSNVTQLLLSFELLEIPPKKIPTAVHNAS